MSLIDRVVTKIERAGGEISEAVGIAERNPGVDPGLIDRIVKVNVALGDLRAAAVKISLGGDPAEVLAALDEQLLDLIIKRGRQ